jgi:hypothetical protein
VSQGEELMKQAGGARCVEIVAFDCWKLISRRIDWRQHLNCGESESAKDPGMDGATYASNQPCCLLYAKDGDSSALLRVAVCSLEGKNK